MAHDTARYRFSVTRERILAGPGNIQLGLFELECGVAARRLSDDAPGQET
jgi:hypothetical protein